MEIVSKSEFATICERSPGAVSHWIKKGQLTAPALIGFGRGAKINVELAKQQLHDFLDVGQQMGLKNPIDLTSTPEKKDGLLPLEEVTSASTKYADLKTEKLEIEVRRQKRQELERQGDWLVAVQASKIWGEELSSLMGAFETFLNSLSEEIAAEFNGDAKEHIIFTRQKFRDFRSRLSQSSKEKQKEEPECIDDREYYNKGEN